MRARLEVQPAPGELEGEHTDEWVVRLVITADDAGEAHMLDLLYDLAHRSDGRGGRGVTTLHSARLEQTAETCLMAAFKLATSREVTKCPHVDCDGDVGERGFCLLHPYAGKLVTRERVPMRKYAVHMAGGGGRDDEAHD